MFQSKVLFAVCCLVSVNLFAAGAKIELPSASPATIKRLVSDFYVKKAQKDLSSADQMLKNIGAIKDKNNFQVCPPNPPQPPVQSSCVNAVCKHMASYQCDDASELNQVARMCANNMDGTCIDIACGHMASYQCDDMSELTQIANSCAFSTGQCLDSACKRMASYQCDDLSEVTNIAKACSGLWDGSCVDAVCSHMASYQCDDPSELISIINSCKNP